MDNDNYRKGLKGMELLFQLRDLYGVKDNTKFVHELQKAARRALDNNAPNAVGYLGADLLKAVGR